MKTFLLSKVLCIAVASLALAGASSFSAISAPEIEDGYSLADTMEGMNYVQTLCDIECPPNPCKPICPPKKCRPICPPNPCDDICPPNPCRPVCPPNPCDDICPETSYTDIEIRRFFASLWRKIMRLRRRSRRRARAALKRKLIEMINYAYSLLACQDCPPEISIFYGYDLRRMTLKKLFYILKTIVCSLNEKNKCCFLQNSGNVFYF